MTAISRYAPACLLGLLCVGFIAAVGLSAPELPQRVATHFDAAGHPNGWMTRQGYLLFISLMGPALALFMVGLTFLTRVFPDWAINLPHKEYWLAPEQRPATNAIMLRYAFWLGCLVLLLFGGIHYLTVVANHGTPVRLPGSQFAVVLGAFFCGMAVWTISLIRRFRRPRWTQ